MTSLKLYEIANQFRELESLADSGDLPPEVIRDTLEGLQGDMQQKGVAVAQFIRNLDVNADVIDEAAKAMQQRANRLRKRAESVKAYLLFNMQATGITKIEAPEFVIALRNNPEAVEIAEGAQIPDELMVRPEPPPPRPDKVKIKAALKAGQNVDGCRLVAGQRVEIRV
jgi:hypothetical protein